MTMTDQAIEVGLGKEEAGAANDITFEIDPTHSCDEEEAIAVVVGASGGREKEKAGTANDTTFETDPAHSDDEEEAITVVASASGGREKYDATDSSSEASSESGAAPRCRRKLIA